MRQLSASKSNNVAIKRWKLSYSSNFLTMNISSPDSPICIDMIAQSKSLFTMVSGLDSGKTFFFSVNPVDKSFQSEVEPNVISVYDEVDSIAKDVLTDLLQSEHMIMMLRKSVRLKTTKLEFAKNTLVDGTIISLFDDNGLNYQINFKKKFVEIEGENFNSARQLPIRYNQGYGVFEYCVGLKGPNVPMNKGIEWKSFFNGCPDMNAILIEKLKSIKPS